jgi:hypothetical protein
MTPSLNSFMSTLLADRGLESNRIILVADNAVRQEASQTASPKRQIRKDSASSLFTPSKSSRTPPLAFSKKLSSSISRWESAPSGNEALDCLVWTQLCLRMSAAQRASATAAEAGLSSALLSATAAEVGLVSSAPCYKTPNNLLSTDTRNQTAMLQQHSLPLIRPR